MYHFDDNFCGYFYYIFIQGRYANAMGAMFLEMMLAFELNFEIN